MSLRIQPKRVRETVQTPGGRNFERIKPQKRLKSVHQTQHKPHLFSQSRASNGGADSTRTTGVTHGPTVPASAEPTPYLFTFTNALKHVLDGIQPAPEFLSATPSLGQPLHTVDEDLVDLMINQPRSGKGQNEMMQDWVTQCGTHYLRRILEAEYVGSEDRTCDTCQVAGDLYDCIDCLHQQILCGICLARAHRSLPTHRFRHWTGKFFNRVSSTAAGYKFHLGHGGKPCTYGHDRMLTLGDLNGIHKIMVRYCRHPGRGDSAHQLLTARIFPCSDTLPASGFTFNVLRNFHLLATEAKLSTQRYYNVLVRHTNNAFPHLVPDRYREFYRVARQWDHLQDLRRAACFTVDLSPTTRGDLILRCPACPRPGVNYVPEDVDEHTRYVYTQHITYDGSFQMVRKNKEFDQFDTCLSEGRRYFVIRDEFQAHLEIADQASVNLSNKNAACNNHKAADASLVRYTGLAETGIGAPLCARHSFYLPLSTVSFNKGERFAFTDFAIASAFRLFLDEGTKDLGLHYDIMCHYDRHLWKRLSAVPAPVGSITRSDLDGFISAVPKFHLAGHTDNCFARYSLNNITGVGRLDGEGGERCWANLNHSAGSTSEKGPGSRLDSINHVMHQWNWSKTTGMVDYLLEKIKEATEMSEEQLLSFEELHESMDVELRERWEAMSTEPKLVNGKWTSVFSMKENSVVSMTATLKSLTEQEEQDQRKDNGSPALSGMSEWVVEGIDLESVQQRLKNDVKAWGKAPTPRQALECAARRKALVARLTAHKEMALRYVPFGAVEASMHIGEEDDGLPELLVTPLPSRLDSQLLDIGSCERVKECERQLRRVACLEALQNVRAISVQKAHMQESAAQQRGGVINVTRREMAQQRLGERLTHARWQYTQSRQQLVSLRMTDQDTRTFHVLQDSDITALTAALKGKDRLGDGYTKMPWYWRVALSDGKADTRHITVSGAAVREEYEESIRVEWFRARERSRRWTEEVQWLYREIATVVVDFRFRAMEWRERKEGLPTPGMKAYAARQEAHWSAMCDDARGRGDLVLKAGSSTCSLAKRVLAEFQYVKPATPEEPVI